ncbi:hypothetical protein DY000_02036918 [Brassica cretica]|uniref:Transmembrane protein n=1 Tax=Brassica cretica TaxID=69181 RepID=A0ABQ7B9D0_BRACR|nr:hypothetical protein DY000_02036918 [Brassica cretica]
MQSGGDFRPGGPPWCLGGSKPVNQYLGEFRRFPLTRRLVKPAAPACVGTYGGGLWRSVGVRLVSCRLWLSRCSLCVYLVACIVVTGSAFRQFMVSPAPVLGGGDWRWLLWIVPSSYWSKCCGPFGPVFLQVFWRRMLKSVLAGLVSFLRLFVRIPFPSAVASMLHESDGYKFRGVHRDLATPETTRRLPASEVTRRTSLLRGHRRRLRTGIDF